MKNTLVFFAINGEIMKVKEKIMNAKIIDDLIETESKKRTFK